MKLARHLYILVIFTVIPTVLSTVGIKIWNTYSIPVIVSLDSLNQELDLEYQAIKQKLSDIGITDEKYARAHNEYYQEYIAYDKPQTTEKVSTETEQFVKKIISRCGLDPKRITIVPFDDSSAAAATEAIIFINEDRFSKLSEAAKSFVIGHEVQHILHHDNFYYYIIRRQFGVAPEDLAKNNNLDHPLIAYSRFIEKRADIETALLGLEWSKAYYAYAKENYQLGDTRGTTHPKRSERFILAQSLLNYMKKNQPQTA